MKKWTNLLAVLVCCLILPAFGEASIKSGSTISGTVRVYLSSLQNISEATLTLDGSYTLGEDGQTYLRGTVLRVENSGGTLKVQTGGQTTAMGTQIKLRRHDSAGENGVRIAEARVPGNLYPGDVEIRVKGTALQIIVSVYMEDYLQGVLPYEMDNSFPLEALKAQAVAARTYALKKMSMQSSLYDVVDTTSDQVYNGTPEGKANCELAVTETSGVIGLVDGEYMATFYTASNGGQTETVKNAWGSASYSYIVMKDDPYDLKNSASIAKSVSFYRDGTTSVAALTELLKTEASARVGSKATVTAITDVRVTNPKYGQNSHVYRTVEVDLEVRDHGTVTVSLDYFGQVEGICAMSINSMQNETLTVSQIVGGFKLTARRYGHGIGLSQRGAQQMAQEGIAYDDILEFYYPGLTQTRFTLERTLLSSLDGTQSTQNTTIIDAKSGKVTLKNPLDVLNMRRSASLSGAILATIPYGTQITVLGTQEDWLRIQYGTLSGYVKAEYIQVEDDTASEEENTSPASGTAVVSLEDESQILNLRASPTTKASVLSYLRSGQKLSVLERYSKWTQVKYGNIVGYVMNDFIVTEEPVQPEEQTTQEEIHVTENTVAIVLPSSGLNLRLSASVRSASVMVLPQGTTLQVTGTPLSGMVPVMLGSIRGYVSRDYVYITDLQAATPEPTATPEGPFRLFAKVNAENGLILRTGPSQQADAVRLLPNGTILEITGEAQSNFFPVLTDKDSGYVSEYYLSFEVGDSEKQGFTEAAPSATPAAISEITEVSGPTPSPVPPPSRILTGDTAYVTASGGVNLRSEPSSDSNIISVIGYMVEIQITGEAVNGFYPVRVGTLGGYVSTAYVALGIPAESGKDTEVSISPTEVSEAEEDFGRVVVTSSNGLNLRESANTGSDVITILPYGTVLTVLGPQEGDFVHVMWDEVDGYVSASFVTPIQ